MVGGHRGPVCLVLGDGLFRAARQGLLDVVGPQRRLNLVRKRLQEAVAPLVRRGRPRDPPGPRLLDVRLEARVCPYRIREEASVEGGPARRARVGQRGEQRVDKDRILEQRREGRGQIA